MVDVLTFKHESIIAVLQTPLHAMLNISAIYFDNLVNQEVLYTIPRIGKPTLHYNNNNYMVIVFGYVGWTKYICVVE